MAKTTQKNGTVKTERTRTVAYSAAHRAGKEILKLNPGIKEVYVTSDGTAFYNRNDAQNHARTLPDKSVTKVQRIDHSDEPAAEEPVQPTGADSVNKAPEPGEDTNDNPDNEE